MAGLTLQRLIDRTPYISRLVRQSTVFAVLQNRKLARWMCAGRPYPPPHAFKQATVRSYADRFQCHVLVETGTYYGAMVLAMRNRFRQIYSIELDEFLFTRATRMFSRTSHVHILHGDSAEKLEIVLAEITEPAVFWLDAHYAGPGTTRASRDTPIARELDLIFKHGVENHIILIDDAHEFGRQPHYPTMAQVRSLVAGARPEWPCEVADNIIRIHPPTPSDRRVE